MPGAAPPASQVLFLTSLQCKLKQGYPRFTDQEIKTERGQLIFSMCQKQGSIPRICWTLDSVFSPEDPDKRRNGTHLGPQARDTVQSSGHAELFGASVTGQRTHLVMSFSGRGQGQCLQDQSFYGQRAGLKAGVC